MTCSIILICMRNIRIVSSLLLTSFLFCSCVTKKTSKLVDLPPIPPTTPFKITAQAATPTPSGAIFFDPFDSGAATPWTFYQGSHTFSNGVLNLAVGYDVGTYAYIRTNYTNISVQADVRLKPKSWGAAVGTRYNWTNGANYQAWLYQSNSTTWPGRFTIEKYNNWYNTWSQVAGMTIPDPGTNWHTIKLTATNNLILANLDNTYALAYTDTSSPFLKGGIDLGVWGGLNAMSAEFDNVTVYDLNTTITNPPPPVIIPQVLSMTKRVIGYQGNNMTLTVVATNNPISYQWCFGGGKKPIAGATNSSLTITNVKTSNAGLYTVYLTNSAGKVYGTANASVFTTNILANCKATTNSIATVTLAWDYNFTNNPAVNAFRIYGGIAPSTYTNFVNVAGQVTTGQVTNVPTGLTNYFAATSVDTNGLESDYSTEISTVIPTPPNSITNMTLQIYWLDALGYPAIQTKMCPFQNATLWYRTNLVLGSWMTATNWIGDRYGNAVYDDAGAKGSPQRFYRASTP